jgi:hypothetical protein
MNIPRILLPLLVVAALFSGYLLRAAFTQPTTTVSMGSAGGKTVECIVDGLKCKGTAAFFTKLYTGVPGIATIETFATEHKAVFSYDPQVITTDRIKSIMEAPLPMRDGSSRQVFTCRTIQD